MFNCQHLLGPTSDSDATYSECCLTFVEVQYSIPLQNQNSVKSPKDPKDVLVFVSYFKSKPENAEEVFLRRPGPGSKDDMRGQEEVSEQRK